MADSKTVVATPSPYDETTPDFIQNGTHVDMERYRATVPLWKRVWQHSLTQMMLLSVQAFCGPAMSDAITGMYIITFMPDQVFTLNTINILKGLGGGGLATPQVSNICTAITYALLAVGMCLAAPDSIGYAIS